MPGNFKKENIRTTMKNRTSFVIAHRLSPIQNADKIVVLGDGAVREEGVHEELMRKNGLYFNFYTKQDALSVAEA